MSQNNELCTSATISNSSNSTFIALHHCQRATIVAIVVNSSYSLLLLLLVVKIANIIKPVETKLTKLSKNKKHHQRISAKLACILVLVGIKCPKSFQGEIDYFYPLMCNCVRKLKICTFSCPFHEMVSEFIIHFMKWTGGSSLYNSSYFQHIYCRVIKPDCYSYMLTLCSLISPYRQ